ncbi:MAG: PIN domain-containing protein [Bryobacterales bacterium]|nr:PIN domain-containing protein [Bryobacterales bacterium]
MAIFPRCARTLIANPVWRWSAILADTSVWIEMFAGRVQARPDDFRSMATCSPVTQEVLQGLRPGREGQLIRWRVLCLPRPADPLTVELFLEAADLSAASGRRGITILSSIDCLIASIAIWHETPAWHLECYFDRLAAFTLLETRSPSGASFG